MRFFRSRIAVVVFLLLLIPIIVLFVTPPRWVLRQLALASADSMMGGSAVEDGRLTRLSKRVLSAYVQAGLASQIARRLDIDDDVPETEALGRIIAFTRDNIVNQNQFRHRPKSWPPLVSGAGYCDQINGAAAMLAARRFEKAELYALYDPTTRRSPHTVGRVWSTERNDWLYFDAFFDRAVIFTKRAGAAPQFLAFAEPAPNRARGAAPPQLYMLDGSLLADFPATFGGYLLSRLRTDGAQNAMNVTDAPEAEEAIKPKPRPKTRPKLPKEAQTARKSRGTQAPAPPPDDTEAEERAYRAMTRAYVAARVDQLFGAPSAGEKFREIAATSAAENDPRAARIARLSSCMVSQNGQQRH